MSLPLVLTSLFGGMFALYASIALAQMLIPYGLPVGLEKAKQAAAPALAEARKNNWTMAVAIVDTAGNLVYFQKRGAPHKRGAAPSPGKGGLGGRLGVRPRGFWDTLAAGGGGRRVFVLQGGAAGGGGPPLVVEGAFVGAIGVSGGTSQQDGQCAKAGADAVK